MSVSQNIESCSINESFLQFLEYHLSKTLAKSPDKNIKWLWCDGIKMPMASQLNKQKIIKLKQVETECWLGINGQEIYKVLIKFGPCSIENLKNELSLTNCVPNEESMDWVKLRIEHKEVELLLN